jgi:hypothetical protein
MADAPAAAAAAAAPTDEDFEAVFAQLTTPDAVKIEQKPDTIADAADAAATAAAAAAAGTTIEIEGALPDPKTVAADGTVAGEKPADEPVKADPKPAAAEPAKAGETDELLRRFATIVREQPAAAAPAAAAADAPSPITPFTPEQQTLVDSYMREFPDVYTAEQLIRKQEYQAFAAWMFDQIRPHITGLQSQTQQIVAQTHAEQLMSAVPDYDDVVDDVLKWIDEQPDYLKGAYAAVAQRGSVPQVVDLINRWRTSPNGKAAPAAAATAGKPAPAADPVVEPKPDPKVERLAKGLKPVGSKGTGVQLGATLAKDDFDGSFEAFAKAG